MKSKKIGMQALKIAIGSSLAIYIANLFGLKYSLAAGSVALLTMVTTKWKTVKLSVARVVTFIISVLMALIIFSAVESEWMAYGIYVFFVVIIAEMLGWGATISVNALIGMHFLEVKDFEFDFIANEFMLVLIGITMALVLNLFYDYGSQRKALVENMRYTEERLQMILGEISAYLARKCREMYGMISVRWKKRFRALSRMPMNIRIIRFTHIRDTISIILKCV